MEPIRVGLVADTGAPTEMAHSMTDLGPLDGTDAWDLTVVSEHSPPAPRTSERRWIGCRPGLANKTGTWSSA